MTGAKIKPHYMGLAKISHHLIPEPASALRKLKQKYLPFLSSSLRERQRIRVGKIKPLERRNTKNRKLDYSQINKKHELTKQSIHS